MAPISAIVRSLEGIMNATKSSEKVLDLAIQQVSAVEFGTDDIWDNSLEDWLAKLPSPEKGNNDTASHAAKLALAVIYLRAKGQRRATDSVTAIAPAEFMLIWSILHNALGSSLFDQCLTGRSHQDFLSIDWRFKKEINYLKGR